MRFSLFSLAGVTAFAAASLAQETATSTLPTSAATSTSEAAAQLSQLADYAYNITKENLSSSSSKTKRRRRGGCTPENLQIRKEWSFFSKDEKVDYIDAVLCLQSTPSKTPADLVPGARSRWFIWEFEQALRNECGYKGTLPYWDWPRSAEVGLENYPVFDGSMTSMSGNGEHIPNEGTVVISGNGLPPILIPPGTGGGCVTSGPFVNYTVNLGPASLTLPGNKSVAVSNPLDYNPRCLKRDLTTAVTQTYANATAVVSLILGNDDVWDFEMTMQGIPGSGNIGVHGGGHYSMGGDPGRDLFVSPGDPAFWHHHGMIDRVYWIWQMLDRKNRLHAVSGTGTFMNEPPSANTTLDTVIDLGYAAGNPIPVGDLMSTTDGPFCYVYI
ncbi:hypothetical protein MPDQ_007465 [Monascus purpureus]|uniref:Tyrosinase copper-binding domain-containing protein n=1 Tax=Monascus purpureus TaxID=5098 RepID=A0A507R6B7_MONPU|nr:hypothetical protein MPDQ_007465 [Monascus purpureus]